MNDATPPTFRCHDSACWLQCPAYVHLKASQPGFVSDATNDGNDAHELIASIVKGQPRRCESAPEWMAKRGFDALMKEAWIAPFIERMEAEVEMSIEIDLGDGGQPARLCGTADLVSWSDGFGTGLVVDNKTGRGGTQQDISSVTQVRCYASMAYGYLNATHGQTDQVYGYVYETRTETITRILDWDKRDVGQWLQTVESAMRKASTADPSVTSDYVTGPACHCCNCAPVCQALAGKISGYVAQPFHALTDDEIVRDYWTLKAMKSNADTGLEALRAVLDERREISGDSGAIKLIEVNEREIQQAVAFPILWEQLSCVAMGDAKLDEGVRLALESLASALKMTKTGIRAVCDASALLRRPIDSKALIKAIEATDGATLPKVSYRIFAKGGKT